LTPVLLDEREHLRDVVQHARAGAHRHAPAGQQVVDLALRGDGRVVPGAEAVGVEGEGLEPGHTGLVLKTRLLLQELTQPTARSVARVGEGREPAGGALVRPLLVEGTRPRLRSLAGLLD